MKTRVYRTGFAALALIFALAACNDLTGAGTGSGETIPEGMGLARIRLGLGGPAQSVRNARTVHPDIGAYDHFDLEFTAPGETTVNETLNSGVTSVTVALAPGDWKLAVKGYVNSGDTTPAITGNTGLSINPGTSQTFDVYLTPDFSSGLTGTLSYNITLPAEVSRAFLGLYPIDDTPGTSHEINISTNAGGTASGTITGLSEGSYRAVIDLYTGSTTNRAAIWTWAAHIYGDSTTPLAHTFTAAHLADCPPVVEGTSLAAKLDAALASTAGDYTIVLDGTESDLTGFTPRNLNVTGNKNINITIRGNGNTVQVLSPGTALFTLGAESGSSLSLAIQDLTLKGLGGNSVPVVQVNSGGTLLMKANSSITGGNTSSATGGGVSVSGGTFTMNGGKVSGNTASSGGGVFVYGGTFTMSGGEVSGNTASSSSYFGGGVYVFYGTFTMSGGVVSGNTSSYRGGGVFVDGGTFTMSGGAVSGNTAPSGGGVFVYGGTFTMSSGVVSGNTASSSGGGVSVSNSGTFTMSGGEVRGNILSGASYGREVFFENGTFNMSGEARPQRVFLPNNTKFITISGPMSGGFTTYIDLGVTGSAPLTVWENAHLLKLAASYGEGDLASLKGHFTLGNSKMTESPHTETPITGYGISDGGLFVTTE
jgi:hypothetical protein